MQQNVQEEVENYDPTTRGGGGAEDKVVVISYAVEPLASQQFIQEYNRKRSIEEELRRGGATNNVSNYVIVSLDLGNYLHSNRQISYSLTGRKGR